MRTATAVTMLTGTLMIAPVALMFAPAFPGNDPVQVLNTQHPHVEDCQRTGSTTIQPVSLHPQPRECASTGDHVEQSSFVPRGIEEDDPRWDCRIDGNRICGPANANAVMAGCYDDQAALVAVWPCHVEVNRYTGESDVFTP